MPEYKVFRSQYIILTLFAFSVFLITPLSYAASQTKELVPNAEKVGQGLMRYMLWDVYDITLYAPNGKFDETKPFALELSYLMSLKGKKIADRSIEEIRAQRIHDEVTLATWHTQLRQIFPDVSNGTNLVGVYVPDGYSVFYEGDKEIGRIDGADFGKAFFDIWLGEKTSEPALRDKLLGQYE